MGITSDRLMDLGLIDEVVPEPLGGCHRDREKTAENLKSVLKKNLEELALVPKERLLSERHQKLMSYGVFEEAIA
jgi:acetyl-CoA carboxylase carboxyl transferase subunit alpha